MVRFQLNSPLSGTSALGCELMGVSVITEGDALGHGVKIDRMSLETVRRCAETYAGGLKVKVNHYSGADAIIGTLRGFRIDGPQLRADMRLLKSHSMTPVLMEMAAEMPDSFGLSISFSGQIEDGENDTKLMRCLEIYSCDIVDQPAANPTGLFSKPFDINPNTKKSMTIETPEYLALQAEHKTTCELAATLKADFEAKVAEVTSLTAKLSEAQTKITDAEKANAELKASAEKAAAEHAAALSDFEKKVELAALAKSGDVGTVAVKLAGDNKNAAKLYEEFAAADNATRHKMLSDPTTGPLIRMESASRHK